MVVTPLFIACDGNECASSGAARYGSTPGASAGGDGAGDGGDGALIMPTSHDRHDRHVGMIGRGKGKGMGNGGGIAGKAKGWKWRRGFFRKGMDMGGFFLDRQSQLDVTPPKA